MKSRAMRRHNDWRKAIRKRNIVHDVFPKNDDGTVTDYYPHLHQYSKGKIHCSCPLCSAKTKNKSPRRSHAWAPSVNWDYADKKKIIDMEQQIEDM